MEKSDLNLLDKTVIDLMVKRHLLTWRKFKAKSRPPELRGELTFLQHFKAQICYCHVAHGTGFQILQVLQDDNNLISSKILSDNISESMNTLIPQGLENIAGWSDLADSLIDFTSKGVGVGELYLPLVIQGYVKSKSQSVGDGTHAGGKTEVKKNGAGIKSQPNTQRKVQNELNKNVFEAHDPGPATTETGWLSWRQWMDTLPKKQQLQKLREYFTALYIDTDKYDKDQQKFLRSDIYEMCDKLLPIRDGQEFGNMIGTYMIKWYKLIDKWDNLIVIDNKNKQFVNIADVDKLHTLPNVRFGWRYRRASDEGADSYQCGDGFVTINIVNEGKNQTNKSKKSKVKLSPELFIIEQEQKQAVIDADNKFVGFLTDPRDPLTQAWKKVLPDDRVDAKDLIVDMLSTGQHGNAEIATQVIKSFC